MTSCEIIGSTANENIDIEELLSIDCIERVSPVIQFDTEIQFGEYKLKCKVQAVHSSFIDVQLSEGAVYMDSSNMPFLLLNKAAAESFSIRDGNKITVATNASVTMLINEDITNALICGTFEDGQETPIVYMSFDFAYKKFSGMSETNLIFALNNKNDLEEVVTSLQRKDITAIYDKNEIVLWELKSQQAWQLFLVSICLLYCATFLMRNRYLESDKVKRDENYALALAGMTSQQIRWIVSLRLVLLHFISLTNVCWISFFAGIFSPLAVIICLIILYIQFIFSSKASIV